jgi:hypothetical protein
MLLGTRHRLREAGGVDLHLSGLRHGRSVQ